MGAYSVPEHIRAMKPRGTMVKAIRARPKLRQNLRA